MNGAPPGLDRLAFRWANFSRIGVSFAAIGIDSSKNVRCTGQGNARPRWVLLLTTSLPKVRFLSPAVAQTQTQLRERRMAWMQ
jgi:hypothetical protein